MRISIKTNKDQLFHFIEEEKHLQL